MTRELGLCVRTVMLPVLLQSPEICEQKPYSYKSDIWSLGCILYELLCLRLPFEGESVQSVFGKIKRGKYYAVNPRYSDETAKLVDELLSIDPTARPSTEQILSRPCLQQQLQQVLSEQQRMPAPPAP